MLFLYQIFKPFCVILFSLLVFCGKAQNQHISSLKNNLRTETINDGESNTVRLPFPLNMYDKAFKKTDNAAGKCIRTFVKEYRNDSDGIFARQIVKTDDGHLLVLATERINPYVAAEEFSFTLLDTNGNIIASRLFPNAIRIYISKVIKLRDGNFVAAGCLIYDYNHLDQYLLKFDQQLNIIWQKKITAARRYNNIADIVESSEGDFYCYVADDHSSMTERRQLLKLNAAGEPVWFKEYDAGANIFMGPGEFNARLVESGSNIYLKYNEESGNSSPNIIKINKSDGNIVWVKRYQLNPEHLQYYAFSVNSLITDHSNLYLCGRATSNSIILKIAPEGNLVRSVIIPNTDVFISQISYKGEGRLIGNISTYLSKNSGVIEMDTSFTVLKKQFLHLPLNGGIFDIVNYSDSTIYGAGNRFIDDYETNFTLQKFNFNSSFASCAVSDPGVNFTDLPVLVVPISSARTDLPLPESADYVGVFSTGTAAFLRYYCGNNVLCNSLKIEGPEIICDPVDTYNYYANRNDGCTAFVNWELDTAESQITIVAKTDDLMSIKINHPGSFWIKAKMFGSCSWVGDSILVQTGRMGSLVLDLGADTTLCMGNSILLNARSGFSSYAWQDGSADSTFFVTIPGVYHVTTTDICGSKLSDTIHVNFHPPIPIDLSENFSMCKNDSVIIAAPAGFINYAWTTNNVSIGTERSIKISPPESSWYKVIAEQTAGCFAEDSVYVTVNRVNAVYLGADTSFCEGQSMILDAGDGFDTYEWNTGSHSKSITVNQAGNYSLKVSSNECFAFDTLNVHVYPLPVFSLGNDTALCDGKQLRLSFNLSKASYAWSNGSKLNSITITEAGQYWLQVSQDGCSFRDSLNVSYNPSPVVMLGNDTTICQGRILVLNALNPNANYQWQDGSSGPSLSVTKADKYWVAVALDHCIASDTIFVKTKPAPYFTLGKDSSLCSGQEYLLTPSINTTASLLWQNGSSAPSFLIRDAGVYSLTASNECGSYADSVTITSGICNIIMPNAFSPNNDGLNDLFRVKYPFPAKEFHFMVYNRWGEKIFETNNMSEGWDGRWKGELSPSGVYVWVIGFRDSDERIQNLKGTVTLLR